MKHLCTFTVQHKSTVQSFSGVKQSYCLPKAKSQLPMELQSERNNKALAVTGPAPRLGSDHPWEWKWATAARMTQSDWSFFGPLNWVWINLCSRCCDPLHTSASKLRKAEKCAANVQTCVLNWSQTYITLLLIELTWHKCTNIESSYCLSQ